MNESPRDLAEKRLVLSNDYAQTNDRLGFILSQKPSEWLKMRIAAKSASETDKLWEATEMGKEEAVLRLKAKSLERQMSAIKTMLDVLSGEARNQF